MIVSAHRSPRLHRPSKSQQPGIVLGLRYERRFVKALREVVKGTDFTVEHNPWFVYEDDETGRGACEVDALLYNDLTALVIEVKYTWVPSAFEKLKNLYCPVVALTLRVPVLSVVVAKRLTPDTPRPRLTLTKSSSPVFQWLETVPLRL